MNSGLLSTKASLNLSHENRISSFWSSEQRPLVNKGHFSYSRGWTLQTGLTVQYFLSINNETYLRHNPSVICLQMQVWEVLLKTFFVKIRKSTIQILKFRRYLLSSWEVFKVHVKNQAVHKRSLTCLSVWLLCRNFCKDI